MTIQPTSVEFAPAFYELFQPAPYKVFYGGRGGAKSRHFARAAVLDAYSVRHRWLCTRQYQTSIRDSVHRLLVDEIERLKLGRYFDVTDNEIRSWNGSEFIFKGLQRSISEIKSTEGIDRCWVEEGQHVTKDGWDTLLPTIRKPDSEIWVNFNTDLEDDATAVQWIKRPPPGTILRKVGWQDNPWFPKNLNDKRLHMLATDPDSYDNVWEGEFKRLTDAAILAKRCTVVEFEHREIQRYFYGADWGFANDPTVLLRCYELNNDLYIDYEAVGYGVEFEELPQLFDSIPGARHWPIKADSSRPETISYMARQGFQISAAEKWPGSVEDGIAHLKGFRHIYIHPRCITVARESRLYSYKVDRKQLDEDGKPAILPIVQDKDNHTWDACRYSLDGYIQRRGDDQVWLALLKDN